MSTYVASFVDTHTVSSSIYQMWSDLMDVYANCLEFVPQKLSSIRFSQPWVTSKTKRINFVGKRKGYITKPKILG